jgi:uncharacterized peroxidase-related enzyme
MTKWLIVIASIDINSLDLWTKSHLLQSHCKGNFMSRIPTPTFIEAAPILSQPFFEDVKKQMGSVPNLYRLTATSPATLETYLNFNHALEIGTLDSATRERIALAVSEINGRIYCLAAHSYVGKNGAKLSDAEITSNRRGYSFDSKANAAVAFAVKVTKARGAVSEQDLAEVSAAGYSNAEALEIVAHVALNTLTNDINIVFKTDVDFPATPKLA